jgi:biopolymer transport protein ExbB/TolQ
MERETGLTSATVGSTAPFVGLFGTVWGITALVIGATSETSWTVAGPTKRSS